MWGMKSPLVAGGMHLQGAKSPERAEEWVVAGEGIRTCGVLRVLWWRRYATAGYYESREGIGVGGGRGKTDLWSTGTKNPKRAEERLVGGYRLVGYEESPEGRGVGGREGSYGPVVYEES
jgi:hypothetical protein